MPQKLSFLFAAHDAGPSAALKKVADEMGARSFLLNAGKVPAPSDEELRVAVIAADVVVVGLSSAATAGIELKACFFAWLYGKRLVFVADTFFAWARGWFDKYCDYVSLVTTVVETEVAAAQARFPQARVVTTGNPAWEEFLQPGDREAARVAMHACGEKVVFISGTKNPEVNREMLQTTADALSRLDVLTRLVFSVHPGDKTDHGVYQSDLWYLLTRAEMPGDQAVYGADIVIAYNAASVAMRAVAHWIPVVAICTPLAVERLASESDGRENHPMLPLAALDGGATPTSMAKTIQSLIHSPDLLVTGQRQFFPPIMPGEYTGALVEAIRSVA